MVKKAKNQLAFDESIYPQPALGAPGNRRSGTDAEPGGRSTAKPAAVAAAQAYLPGLSRRGRPRLKNPKSAAVRAGESRLRRAAAGAKRIELVLDAETVRQLNALTEYFKLSRVELINRLVTKAARRIKSQA